MSNPQATSSQTSTQARLPVGISEMVISDDASKTIVTHALGSCVGVTVYDPQNNVGGMLHYMLPSSKKGGDKAGDRPLMYADTGVPTLFKEAYKLGAQKSRLIVCAAGGAGIIEGTDLFQIGQRNRTILRKILWKNEVLLAGEDTGGTDSRTMFLNLSDGRVEVHSHGNRRVLWEPGQAAAA